MMQVFLFIINNALLPTPILTLARAIIGSVRQRPPLCGTYQRRIHPCLWTGHQMDPVRSFSHDLSDLPTY